MKKISSKELLKKLQNAIDELSKIEERRQTSFDKVRELLKN